MLRVLQANPEDDAYVDLRQGLQGKGDLLHSSPRALCRSAGERAKGPARFNIEGAVSDKETYVVSYPDCDLHKLYWGQKREAHFDAKTRQGPWAYMCDECYGLEGVGLGLGRGQRLILLPPPEPVA